MPIKLNPKSDSYEALMFDVLTDVHHYTPRPGAKVLDLGAHCGFFSLYCAARGAHVKAYEPNSELMPELIHSAAIAADIGIGSINPVCKAVWWHRGTGYLCRRSNSSAANTVVVPYNEKDPHSPQVLCESLNDAMEWTTWDCVKVDIEGSEYEVFMPAEVDVFQRIGYLTIEIHNDLLNLKKRRELGEKLISSFPHHKIYPVKGTEDIATLVCWQ